MGNARRVRKRKPVDDWALKYVPHGINENIFCSDASEIGAHCLPYIEHPIKFGEITIIQNGKLSINYSETECSYYMKNSNIEITVDILNGSKKFTAYTMDLTKKYIEINADYRT